LKNSGNITDKTGMMKMTVMEEKQSHQDAPRLFISPDQERSLLELIKSELARSDAAWFASAFYSPLFPWERPCPRPGKSCPRLKTDCGFSGPLIKSRMSRCPRMYKRPFPPCAGSAFRIPMKDDELL
jgi:hypothetical protein